MIEWNPASLFASKHSNVIACKMSSTDASRSLASGRQPADDAAGKCQLSTRSDAKLSCWTRIIPMRTTTSSETKAKLAAEAGRAELQASSGQAETQPECVKSIRVCVHFGFVSGVESRSKSSCWCLQSGGGKLIGLDLSARTDL